MAAPKLKPTAMRGRLYSLSSQSRAAKHVGGFCAAVVRSLAESCAAKVEAQDRKGEPPGGIVEGLHGVVDDLVVEVAAVEGVGVADERGKGSVGSAFVQKGFKTAGGAGQIQTAQYRDFLTLARLGGCESGAHSTPHSTRKRR